MKIFLSVRSVLMKKSSVKFAINLSLKLRYIPTGIEDITASGLFDASLPTKSCGSENNMPIKKCSLFFGESYLTMTKLLLAPEHQKIKHNNAVSCVVLDDTLASRQSAIESTFNRDRHGNIEVYFLSQRCFQLQSKTRHNSNIINLFAQTAKTVKFV